MCAHLKFQSARGWLSGILFAAALALPGAAALAQRAAVVGVDKVRSESVSQTFPVIGRLVARRAGVVAARVGGPVAEMHVEVGDRVKKGAVLAVLVSDGLGWQRERRAATVTQQQAKLRAATAKLQLKQQEMQRLVKLRDNNSAAFRQALYDDKLLQITMLESDLAEAQARLKQANAELRLAELDLRYAKIRAPYAGVVSLRHTEIGNFLKVGEPVVTLINDQHLEVEADVPSDRIRGLTKGRKIVFEVEGIALYATVRAIVPEENPQTRTRAVRFKLDMKMAGSGFAVNQSVTVLIPIASERAVVSVHKDAVLNRRGKDMVYVVVEGAAKPRPVSLGDAVGDRFIVHGGLKPGEIVVVRGNERLFPGQPVKF
jgi:RND family efflux transporter MFP subunit